MWQTAGHVDNFIDPLIECKTCHERHRADQLLSKHNIQIDNPQTPTTTTITASASASASTSALEDALFNHMHSLLMQHRIPCPDCGAVCSFTPPRTFNLLFSTHYASTATYLRPETAQGIFINFPHLLRIHQGRLPLGVGQIGKSFRNEINAAQFLFRRREFEQMELEYFVAPHQAEHYYTYWVNQCHQWLLSLRIQSEMLRCREIPSADLAFYARACTDIEFLYPHGWGELWGIADRGNHDLKQHQQHSGQSMHYTEPEGESENKDSEASSRSYLPYIIEPAVGLDRLFYALLCSAYTEETIKGRKRVLLRLHPSIAPYQLAVFPLHRSDTAMTTLSESLYNRLLPVCAVDYDTTGSIGKRYRRQDEIGTPYCITIDHQSLEDQTVTVRDRDSLQQYRIQIEALIQKVKNKELFEDSAANSK